MFWEKPDISRGSFYVEPTDIDNPATLSEQFFAARKDMHATGQLASGRDNLAKVYSDQIARVKELTGKDLWNPETFGIDRDPEMRDRYWSDWNTYQKEGGTLSGTTYRRIWQEQEFRRQLEAIANDRPDLRSQLLPETSFRSQGIKSAIDARQKSADVWQQSQQRPIDYMASFGGMVVGGLEDPVNILTLPFGFGGVGKGMQGILMGGLKAGTANALVEAGVQPFIKSYNERVGLPYGWGDAAIGVGSAFAFGAGVDMTVRGAYRGLAGQFGYAPVVKDGVVVAWRKGRGLDLSADVMPSLPNIPKEIEERANAGDAKAQAEVARILDEHAKTTGETVIPHTTMEKAAQGDPDALRKVYEPMAKDDPVIRQALDTAEADAIMSAKPSDLVDDATHAVTLTQALRHANEPDVEPLPVRVDVDPPVEGVRPKIEKELQALREQVAKGQGNEDLAARVAELEGQIKAIDAFGSNPIADAQVIRDNGGKITADVDAGSAGVRKARALASLSDEAFDMVKSGQAPQDLGVMVADFAGDPATHARLLTDVMARNPAGPEDARAMIADLLQSPDYAPKVEVPAGPVADAAGSPRLMDDPTGPEAKAQVARLEQQLAEELGGGRPDPVEILKTPEGQAAAIARADGAQAAIADLVGIVPADVNVIVFSAIDDLPQDIRAQVRAGNAATFAAALERFQAATSRNERARARATVVAASKGQGIEGIARDSTIYLASYAMDPKGRLAHEVVHVLKTTGRLSPEEVTLLARAAREAGIWSDSLEATYRGDLETRMSPDRVRETLEEEAAAHYIEAVARGEVVARTETIGLIERLKALFRKIKAALVGQGFVADATDPAQDVAAAILAGHVARREQNAEWMRVRPDELPGAEPEVRVTDGEQPSIPDANTVAGMAARVIADVAQGGDPQEAVARELAETMGIAPIPEAGRFSSDDIESIVDMWRYVREDHQKPQGLVDFLRERGGVADLGGDVRSQMGGANRRPGLVNTKGRNLDDAALMAYEAGYFTERPTVAELFDAIDRDLRGDFVIRLQDFDALDDYRVALEMRNELEQLGLGRARSVEDVRQSLREQDAAPEGGGGQGNRQEDIAGAREQGGGKGNEALAPPMNSPEDRYINRMRAGGSQKTDAELRAQYQKQIARMRGDEDSEAKFAMRDTDTGRSMRADLDRLGYFSGALEAAKRLRQAKGTPEQMLRMLEKEGAKKAEIEATNLAQLFEGKKSITKQEIIDYLEANRVGVREVQRGTTPEQLAAEARMNELRDQMQAIQREDYVKTGGFRDEKVLAADYPEYAALVAEFDDLSARNFGPNRKANEPTKWSSYSLDPNNPTYRETVLHLPSVKDAFDSGNPIHRAAHAIYKWLGDRERATVALRREVESFPKDPDTTPKRETLAVLEGDGSIPTYRADGFVGPGNDSQNFESGHFPEPNIVGHMMTSMVKVGADDVVPMKPMRRFDVQGILLKMKPDEAIAKGLVTPDEVKAVRKHKSDVYLIDQIQSDWGQKLRDGGVRDEAKIAELERALASAEKTLNEKAAAYKASEEAIADQLRAAQKADDDAELARLEQATRPAYDDWRASASEMNRIKAELITAKGATPGHPLVNTTDQWTNTTLRRAIRQAVEADAEYIAIPSGDTVLSYNPGDADGMRGFYGATKMVDREALQEAEDIVDLTNADYRKAIEDQSQVQRRNAEQTTPNSANELRAAREAVQVAEDAWTAARKDLERLRKMSDRLIDGIVPKNLKNLLKKIDKQSPDPVNIDKLDTPTSGMKGNGFTLFKLTDKVKQSVKEQGQPLFAMRSDLDMSPEARKARAEKMGFDTSKILYHGSEQPVPESGFVVDFGQKRALRQPGVFFSESPDVASTVYAFGPERDVRFDPASGSVVDVDPRPLGRPSVGAFYLRRGRQYVLDVVELEPRLMDFDTLAEAQGVHPDLPDRITAKLWELKSQGYDSVVIRNNPDGNSFIKGGESAIADEIVVFDPSNIRSVNAAFDPAKADSPNLMYAMRNDNGRMKPGAVERAEAIQTDLAEIEAALKGAQIDEREALQRKRASLLNGKAHEVGLDDAYAYRTPRGEQDPAMGFLRLHETYGQGGAMDVVNLSKVIQGEALAKFGDAAWELRKGAVTGDLRRHMGQTKTLMENVIREAAGQSTKDPLAARLAKAWIETAEWLRQSFNAAGGDIGKLKGWFAPQYHNAEALLRAGRDKWVSYIMPLLDRERMTSADGVPLTNSELRSVLEDIWVTITTDGANTREATGHRGKGALYKRHAEHRVLHFKDGDAFLKYAKDFGSADPYAMMIGHINMMARDIAAMRRFGANPEVVRERIKQQIQIDAQMQRSARSMFDELSDMVGELQAQVRNIKTPADAALARLAKIHTELDKVRGKPKLMERRLELDAELGKAHDDLRDAMTSGALTPEQTALVQRIGDLTEEMAYLNDNFSVMSRNPVERGNRILHKADEIWKLYIGSTNTPISSTFASFMQGSRNIVSASTLPFASISAISDQATSVAARAFNDMPVTSQLSSFIKAFTPEDRKFALRARLGLDQARTAFAIQSRFVGWINTRSVTGYLADRTHALSLLSPMTQAAKLGYMSDFMADMADMASTTAFKDLSRPKRDMWLRHGLKEADWAALRTVKPETHRGVPVMTSEAIEASVGPELAEKYMVMLMREQAQAVIEPTLESRAFFISDLKSGALAGEVARTIAMLKSFPTVYMMLVMGRAYNDMIMRGGLRGNNAAYLAALLFGGTMLGAMAKQMKHVSQGRDPEDMRTTKFWGGAFMQAGGLGIYGDFIFNSTNRYGNGLAQTLMGPMADRATNVLNLTFGNVIQYAQDEKTNAGREAVQFMRMNTPVVPFYLRQAYERLILDELQKAVDPEAHKSFRSRINNIKKVYGNKYYWPPGSTEPRAPNFNAAFGGR
jgi:hypothetical protein